MRTVFFALSLFCCICAGAQGGNVFTKVVTKEEVQAQVVRDSAGTVFPFEVWSALLRKGYTLRRKKGTEDYLLTKLPDSVWQARLSAMPPPAPSAAFRTGQKFAPIRE